MSNTFKTGFFLILLTVLIMAVGRLFGGQQGMVIAFLFAIIMNAGSYWFSDKIVLKIYKAREVSSLEEPELHAMVANLAHKAYIPKPKVYVIPSETPNAFATGRNPEHAAVAVTDGIRRILDREELEGVLAHELSHVKNRDILISTIAAMLIQMAISRSREYLADATGAKIAGNPQGLASALEKLEYASKKIPMNASPSTAHMFIVNPLSGRSLAGLFSTHPPIQERVKRLRGMFRI